MKRQRSIKEVGTSSQALSWPQQTSRTSTIIWAQGNIPYPLSLTNPDHVARYAYLNECMVMAIHYYDEELLGHLVMLDDILWLFVRGSMGHFIEIKEHTYQDLTLEFLSTLYVEVAQGPQCQAGYISFYFQGNFMSWTTASLVFHLHGFTKSSSPTRIQAQWILGWAFEKC